jgi:hypothetical protein
MLIPIIPIAAAAIGRLHKPGSVREISRRMTHCLSTKAGQVHSEGAANLKYLSPDEVQFDVRQKGWDEAIGLGMPRYELTPAKEAA